MVLYRVLIKLCPYQAKIIAGDDSLFNIPVEVHSRVSFSQLRNGLCTKCMYSLIIHERYNIKLT